MSESPFAFQDEPPVAVTEESADGSKRNLVTLVALAVVAGGAGAFFLLGGSDDPTEEVAFAPATRAPRVVAPVAPPAPLLPEESETQLGENPFKALVTKPVAAAPAAPAPVAAPVAPPVAAPVIVVTTGTTEGGAATTTIATSPAPKAPAPAPKAPAPAPKAPAPAPAPVVSTVTFTAVSGSEPVGTFLLDGKSYTAAKGETFGGKVKVMDLRKNLDGAWLAVLQVGDGTPFDIYENQQVVIP